MHFSTAALLAFSSVSITYAAPFANTQNEDLSRRKATYDVVNVDEDSSSSAVPEIDTVFETSTVTAPGANPVPVTVTVTATPSSSSIARAASSTPCYETPAARTDIPLPSIALPEAGSNTFFRRGLRAAGQPALFAREYASSASSSASASASASLYAREYPQPSSTGALYVREYSTSSVLPTSSASLYARQWATASPSSSVSLVPRQFGGWYSSAPSSTVSVPVSATPLVARQFSEGYSTSLPAFSSATPSSSASLFARGWYSSASGTPSSSATPTSAVPLAVRGEFGWYSPVASSSSIPTPTASPSLVARRFGSWASSSISTPVSSAFATPVIY